MGHVGCRAEPFTCSTSSAILLQRLHAAVAHVGSGAGGDDLGVVADAESHYGEQICTPREGGFGNDGRQDDSAVDAHERVGADDRTGLGEGGVLEVRPAGEWATPMSEKPGLPSGLATSVVQAMRKAGRVMVAAPRWLSSSACPSGVATRGWRSRPRTDCAQATAA